MLKTDCIYLNYEEDMGKSIPYCEVKKHKCTPCMCDTELSYYDEDKKNHSIYICMKCFADYVPKTELCEREFIRRFLRGEI